MSRVMGSVRRTSFAAIRARFRREKAPAILPAMDERAARDYLEQRVRATLNMSTEQFVAEYKAGTLPDTSRIHGLAMLTGETLRPRGRSGQRTNHRKEPVRG